MNAWAHWKTPDRYHRHVRSARLCVAPQAPVHRLAFLIEEALRLASLPGENEGRSYYFRHLGVAGLPQDGERGQWLERFERALVREAQQATHGADPRAAFSNAVFFRGEPEALEILLRRLLWCQAIGEWFWPMVMGRDSSAGDPSIVDIVEKLRDRPASWVAVAAAVFADPGLDAVRILAPIPSAVTENWLRELTGPQPLRGFGSPRIPPQELAAVRQASRVFGSSSPRALWLATLAILLHSPAEMDSGTAVWRARHALQSLAPSAADDPLVIDRESALPNAPRGPAKYEKAAPDSPAFVSPAERHGITLPASSQSGSEPETRGAGEPMPTTNAHPALPVWPGTPPPVQPPTAPATLAHPAPAPWYCSGLPTSAAGLFFLLNALHRIGMPGALAAGLARGGPNFPVRVLERLAAHAGTTPEDPVTVWLRSLLANDSDGGELFPCDASCWPVNLRFSPTVASDSMVRVWSLAVRRWCWRVAGIPAREVISRSGVFSVNRTDLDVSLPLDQTDVRARRAGLDLDPGWLPWFGRVVRFHYLFRGEFRA